MKLFTLESKESKERVALIPKEIKFKANKYVWNITEDAFSDDVAGQKKE